MRSTLVASLTLVTAFTSLAAAEQRFAQPPPSSAPRVATADELVDYAPPQLVDRAKVRAKLAANRGANLARFRMYQNTGVFPSNTYQDGSLNVWLDEEGHFCAAATIIRMSGGVALTDKVAEQNNFIKLGDVTQGPVMDWILTSGFTQGEIAAIQEPFRPVYIVPDEPTAPRIVDNGLRNTEDARLRAKYKSVEADIVKNRNASLDAATDRLMKNPKLARAFLAST